MHDVVCVAVSGGAAAADAAAVADFEGGPLPAGGAALGAGQGQRDEGVVAVDPEDDRAGHCAGQQVESGRAEGLTVVEGGAGGFGQGVQVDQDGQFADPGLVGVGAGRGGQVGQGVGAGRGGGAGRGCGGV